MPTAPLNSAPTRAKARRTWLAAALAVAAASPLAGCMFREEEHIDAKQYFAERNSKRNMFICVISPDNNDLFSTAPRELREGLRLHRKKHPETCSPLVDTIPFYFHKDNSNIVFELEGCRITKAYTLIGPGNAIVEASTRKCGKPSDFTLIEKSRDPLQFRIVRIGEEMY
jgi:hypothetical protein